MFDRLPDVCDVHGMLLEGVPPDPLSGAGSPPGIRCLSR
ncbi:hypothetical protein LptCag_0271 [Leptospirillum ferriphilum]|uniref:Uncharacterized protein n=1 Tax=Leptospirillum ferriphilum TaxID=178606 RepID=A0A094W9P6_9BACT|nr:hypothetical protein LptCag_0271 [Leptospirillum ferriphilum]